MFFYKYRYDFKSKQIEATLSVGSRISTDYISAESELVETWLDHGELDFLIYNEPKFYVEVVLIGCIEEYRNTVREGQKF